MPSSHNTRHIGSAKIASLAAAIALSLTAATATVLYVQDSQPPTQSSTFVTRDAVQFKDESAGTVTIEQLTEAPTVAPVEPALSPTPEPDPVATAATEEPAAPAVVTPEPELYIPSAPEPVVTEPVYEPVVPAPVYQQPAPAPVPVQPVVPVQPAPVPAPEVVVNPNPGPQIAMTVYSRVGTQVEIDQCAGAVLYTWSIIGEHNGCGGERFLSLNIGDTVLLTGAKSGLFVVTEIGVGEIGTTNYKVPAYVALQTCVSSTHARLVYLTPA